MNTASPTSAILPCSAPADLFDEVIESVGRNGVAPKRAEEEREFLDHFLVVEEVLRDLASCSGGTIEEFPPRIGVGHEADRGCILLEFLVLWRQRKPAFQTTVIARVETVLFAEGSQCQAGRLTQSFHMGA